MCGGLCGSGGVVTRCGSLGEFAGEGESFEDVGDFSPLVFGWFGDHCETGGERSVGTLVPVVASMWSPRQITTICVITALRCDQGQPGRGWLAERRASSKECVDHIVDRGLEHLHVRLLELGKPREGSRIF